MERARCQTTGGSPVRTKDGTHCVQRCTGDGCGVAGGCPGTLGVPTGGREAWERLSPAVSHARRAIRRGEALGRAFVRWLARPACPWHGRRAGPRDDHRSRTTQLTCAGPPWGRYSSVIRPVGGTSRDHVHRGRDRPGGVDLLRRVPGPRIRWEERCVAGPGIREPRDVATVRPDEDPIAGVDRVAARCGDAEPRERLRGTCRRPARHHARISVDDIDPADVARASGRRRPRSIAQASGRGMARARCAPGAVGLRWTGTAECSVEPSWMRCSNATASSAADLDGDPAAALRRFHDPRHDAPIREAGRRLEVGPPDPSPGSRRGWGMASRSASRNVANTTVDPGMKPSMEPAFRTRELDVRQERGGSRPATRSA